MKQNITLAVDKRLLQRARGFAAQRGVSVSALLAGELKRLVADDEEYDRAKTQALARLKQPFHLGGARIRNREALHDRQRLR